jgi:hypothetical protein
MQPDCMMASLRVEPVTQHPAKTFRSAASQTKPFQVGTGIDEDPQLLSTL